MKSLFTSRQPRSTHKLAASLAAVWLVAGCAAPTASNLTGTWTLTEPKSTVELDVNTSTVKDGKVVTSTKQHAVPVSKTVQFTSDGFCIEERKANESVLSGIPTRWKVTHEGSGVLTLRGSSGESRKVTVQTRGNQLIVDSDGNREVYTRSSSGS